MKTLRMKVDRMTCDDCKRHVARALEQAGASFAEADWRRGEAVFSVPRAQTSRRSPRPSPEPATRRGESRPSRRSRPSPPLPAPPVTVEPIATSTS
jgi:copper chaperone CopZ